MGVKTSGALILIAKTTGTSQEQTLGFMNINTFCMEGNFSRHLLG